MDDVGSEIGQKMRSAIKAKLTELGCYVDDELPDYVMVMVANKRTRAQMEDDLQLFLGDNTELFVNWLHQVLKKLQEVTVTAPLKLPEQEKGKERSLSKERKSKDKKDKSKKGDSVKKSKKKEKLKLSRKKEEKKVHKSKKKSKHHGMIRPNVPPLLMNIEKESEPSITDVFAGQILKNHGITLDTLKDEPKQIEKKPDIQELKRPILPIIDPATISQIDPDAHIIEVEVDSNSQESTAITSSSGGAPREEQIKEINEIEAKIQGLKQKLADQLDSMSDDEDFLNIRTEAEELMNDFAEDVFQEISEQAPVSTPPISARKSPTPPPPPERLTPSEVPKPLPKDPIETLPQIELKLPKRPVRERLGAREESKKVVEKPKEIRRTDSPERFTPEREPEFRPQNKSAKSRLGDIPDAKKRDSLSDDSPPEKSESKRLTSKVSVLESRPSRSSCASVVRVRPRPRVGAPASSLLLRAVADAHKSLLNIPPKVDSEPQKVKRALVLPMRRCVDAQKIVIQVPGADNNQDNNSDNISLGGDMDSEDDKSSKVTSEADKEEYTATTLAKKTINNDYASSRRPEGRTTSRRDDTLIIETLNIHNPTVDKDKNTQFIVTMDGYHPNAFLAKKLMTEGILAEAMNDKSKDTTHSVLKTTDLSKKQESLETSKSHETIDEDKTIEIVVGHDTKDKNKRRDSRDPEGIESESNEDNISSKKERVSNASEESDTQVVVKKENIQTEKRRSTDESAKVKEKSPPAKKRKRSPIVFNVKTKEKEVERVRERTESVSSDSVVITTAANTHKYDSLLPLCAAERKPSVWCRTFPLCRYGSSCAFQHPRCKFAAACTRRGCVYAHAHNIPPTPPAPATPLVASHVVPAANYKTITPGTLPSICKFYPNCTNSACHFYHPKPCRYGKACLNKLECNFYHADINTGKYRYPI